ncbi:recombination mediator RecR [Candidatus Gracilibacteria bacterium]|nr:recombination mediator RecR [Candidatus Gracilibacteria bacterium]
MTNFLPKSIRTLIEEFSRLPGVGPKSAQRLAMHLLRSPRDKIVSLGQAVTGLKDDIVFCETCWNIAERNPCYVCDNPSRDKSLICVVEEILDAVAIEKTAEFSGVYHVLHGRLSPVDGIGPDQLKILELVKRIEDGADVSGEKGPKINEVILATNPSLEGEATALYIQKALIGFDVKVTRIARGLPVGGDVEYADEITLMRAMKGRGDF